MNSKDRKAFCADLKEVYNAASKHLAETAFEIFREKWTEKYPLAVRVWENNIEHVFQLFQYPQEIRNIIYTTNAVESYNSQLRSVVRGKGALPNEESVMKLFYLRTVDIVNKWNKTVKNWSQVLNQLMILFEDRIKMFLY